VQASRDLYELLGVPRESSRDDIRNAHRRLVRRYHPDANPDDRLAEERFKEIQQAYEILSDPEKRREYDRKLLTSSRRGSRKPRPRAGGRTGGDTADLSDLLSKLADLSSDRSAAREAGSFQLTGEEVARLARVLGLDISRISDLVGKDITRLSKLLGENIKLKAEASIGHARSGRFSSTDEGVSSAKRAGTGNRKDTGTQRKEKRVKGPKARRKRN
jgi:curved DNA-binding protein CbpA